MIQLSLTQRLEQWFLSVVGWGKYDWLESTFCITLTLSLPTKKRPVAYFVVTKQT